MSALATSDFAQLPEVERDLIRRWHDMLARVRRPIGEALTEVARNMGVSLATARRNYDRWLRSNRDPLSLVNRSRVREPRENLPAEFIAEWRRRSVGNQRKFRPAYQDLVRDFFAGKPIPGVPDDAPRDRLPDGWSYTNLMRFKPTSFEVTAFRIGRTAAADHRPMVYTTRANLWVGSHYLFDDIWHDLMVNVLDTQKTGRPLEFHALDLASACKVGWGFRVRTESDLTGRMEGLREENMRWIVAQVLSQHGYDAQRGTVLVVEHGTAAIRPDLESLILQLTNGKVTVSRSGMTGDPAFVGQYAGRGKGNFRFKAALESLGNLIHNRTAALPAQTGMDVAHRPESLHGELRHNDALLAAFAALAEHRPELAEQLRFPLLSHVAFGELLVDIYGEINRRTEHRLEGWSRHVVPSEDGMVLRRKSPWEVWSAGRAALTRLPESAVATMLWTEALAEERKVSRRMLEVWAKDLSPDVQRYDARALPEGQTFACIVNPFAPDVLWAYGARGEFVAACPLMDRADRADQRALEHAFGRAAKSERELLDPVADLGREIVRRRIEDARHNAGVLAEAVDLKSAAKAARQVARAAEAGSCMVEETNSRSPGSLEPEAPEETLDVRDAVEPGAGLVDVVDARW